MSDQLSQNPVEEAVSIKEVFQAIGRGAITLITIAVKAYWFIGAMIVIGLGLGFWMSKDHQEKYEFHISLRGPHYFDNGSRKAIVGNNLFHFILDNRLQAFQQKNQAQTSQPHTVQQRIENNVALMTPINDQDTTDETANTIQYDQLTTIAPLAQRSLVQDVFDHMFDMLSQAPELQNQIKIWQQAMDIDLKKRQIEYLKTQLKQLQDRSQQLATTAQIGSIEGQAILSEYGKRLSSTQQKIQNLKISIDQLKQQKDSLVKKVTPMGSLVHSKDPVDGNKKDVFIKIVIAFMLLAILLTWFWALLRYIVRAVRQEL